MREFVAWDMRRLKCSCVVDEMDCQIVVENKISIYRTKRDDQMSNWLNFWSDSTSRRSFDDI